MSVDRKTDEIFLDAIYNAVNMLRLHDNDVDRAAQYWLNEFPKGEPLPDKSRFDENTYIASKQDIKDYLEKAETLDIPNSYIDDLCDHVLDGKVTLTNINNLIDKLS